MKEFTGICQRLNFVFLDFFFLNPNDFVILHFPSLKAWKFADGLAGPRSPGCTSHLAAIPGMSGKERTKGKISKNPQQSPAQKEAVGREQC